MFKKPYQLDVFAKEDTYKGKPLKEIFHLDHFNSLGHKMMIPNKMEINVLRSNPPVDK